MVRHSLQGNKLLLLGRVVAWPEGKGDVAAVICKLHHDLLQKILT